MHKKLDSRPEVTVQDVAAKKFSGVQCENTLDCKTRDILMGVTFKQVEMIVKEKVNEVLELHNCTLDASEYESVESWIEKFLEKLRSQIARSLCPTRTMV